MYLLSTGAGATASGNTFLTSCAETPTYVISLLNPNSAAVSLKLKVNPLNDTTLSRAFVISALLVLRRSSDAKAIMLISTVSILVL